MRKQKGFTLIELIMVIVILGILSAVALPRFIDLSGEATTAAVQGVSGAVSSASATNFAARKAGNATAVVVNAASVCSTTILGGILQGGWPTGYTTSGTGDCSGTADSVSCSVGKTGATQTATATVYCAR